MVFALNNRELSSLHIINYSVKLETLDGEGTGRSKAYGWPMIRDPQGRIVNLNLELAATNSQVLDFIFLWDTCWDMGDQDFALIKFMLPTGRLIEQNMYLVLAEQKCKRITVDDVVYTDVIKVSFIAEKGM